MNRFLFTLLILLSGWFYIEPANASFNCGWSQPQGMYTFGTVTAGQTATTTNTFTLSCSNYSSNVEYVRFCMNLTTENSPLSMTVNGDNSSLLYFNIYPLSNQESPLSANSNVFAQLDLTIPAWGSSSGDITLIGKIIAGQTKVRAMDYYNYRFDSYVKYIYVTDPAQLPSCSAMPIVNSVFKVSSGATSTVKNGCAIAQVENMNFGQLSPVNSPRLTGSATSSVTVSCPVNTTFSVALGDGLHNQQSVRNMCNSSNSDCIPYQLYQDAAHTQQWNTTNTQTVNIGNDTTKTLTVYGFVPSQDWPSAGDYSDTVTVTLSY